LLALRVGPLYAPFNFFVWWWRFGDARGTEEIWRQGAWLVSVPSHAAVFVAIVVAVRRARRLTGPTDTHGSARWATRADLTARGQTTCGTRSSSPTCSSTPTGRVVETTGI